MSMPLEEASLAATGIGFFGAAYALAAPCLLSLAVIALLGLAFVLLSMVGVHLVAHSVHGVAPSGGGAP
jgi:hypothetical protein